MCLRKAFLIIIILLLIQQTQRRRKSGDRLPSMDRDESSVFEDPERLFDRVRLHQHMDRS